MANIIVNSAVMRDKATTIEKAAIKIQTTYEEMLKEVNTTASKMKGTTIDTQRKQFASMQSAFDVFSKDIKAYAAFLQKAAEFYEVSENEAAQKAGSTGKPF